MQQLFPALEINYANGKTRHITEFESLYFAILIMSNISNGHRGASCKKENIPQNLTNKQSN